MTGDPIMPRDPFEPDGSNALGVIGEILGEGHLLLDALREAQDHGKLLDAVFALDGGDLRAVVIERLVSERFRGGFGPRGGES